MKKKCFKCLKEKNIDSYYKHPGMADGRLNKCKDCTCSDTKRNYRNSIDYYKAYNKMRHKKGYIKPIRVTKKVYYSTVGKEERNKYRVIHQRVQRLFGTPKKCERCEKDNLAGKEIHWANINHQYSLKREDWARLCRRCHYTQDRKLKYKQ